MQINGNPVSEDDLSYTDAFIYSRTYWDSAYEIPPTTLRPPVSTEWDELFDSSGVSRKAWKGFCCPNCGKLSCREHWNQWECTNKNCSFTLVPKKRPTFTAARLADPHRPIYTGPVFPQNSYGSEIRCTRSMANGFAVFQYELPDGGTVTHMLANSVTNSQSFDADWLLMEYQQSSMPFRRHKLQTASGVTRTAHFTYNVVSLSSYHYDHIYTNMMKRVLSTITWQSRKLYRLRMLPL